MGSFKNGPFSLIYNTKVAQQNNPAFKQLTRSIWASLSVAHSSEERGSIIEFMHCGVNPGMTESVVGVLRPQGSAPRRMV